jgi:hypothetical protein
MKLRISSPLSFLERKKLPIKAKPHSQIVKAKWELGQSIAYNKPKTQRRNEPVQESGKYGNWLGDRPWYGSSMTAAECMNRIIHREALNMDQRILLEGMGSYFLCSI